MKIEITPEMLARAKQKQEQEKQLLNDAPNEGYDNICVSCE